MNFDVTGWGPGTVLGNSIMLAIVFGPFFFVPFSFLWDVAFVAYVRFAWVGVKTGPRRGAFFCGSRSHICGFMGQEQTIRGRRPRFIPHGRKLLVTDESCYE